MKDIISFLTTKEVLIVIGLLVGILLIYFGFWFFEYLKKMETKKNLQNNTIKLKRLVEEENLKQQQETLPEVFQEKKEKDTPSNLEITEEIPLSLIQELNKSTTTNEQKTILNQNVSLAVPENKIEQASVDTMTVQKEQEKDKKEEVIEYKEEVYTQDEAKQELERLTEELQKEKEKEDKNIKLTDFEISQEENAIISLEELLTKGKMLTSMNELTQYEDEGNEPISLEELEQRYQKEVIEKVSEAVIAPTKKEIEPVEIKEETEPKKEIKKEQISLFDMNTVPYQTASGYKPSPIISPIFGIEKEHIAAEKRLELENTANYEKLDAEIQKTNEFLAKLRDLQKKLD